MAAQPQAVASGLPTSPTLGVVAICYNEELDLPGFLAHLLPWVDEIVILDDGSSDRTSEIAARCPPQVRFLCAPRGEGEFYAHQRNKGIEVARSDWLLHMDIDERVPPDLAREILVAVRDDGRDAYRFRRLNYFLHRPMRGGGWQDWNLVHLARRETLHFEGMFHERVVTATTEDRIGQLAHAMTHLNDDSYRERMRKSDSYTDEIVDRVRRKHARVRAHHLLVRPLAAVAYRYLYKRGYRDGVPGLISALHSGCAVFRAHAIAWDEQNRIDRSSLEARFPVDGYADLGSRRADD